MLRIRHWKIGVVLLLFTLPSGRAAALESFTATVSFYQGVSLASGMTAFDPTVLTLIIGSAQEIDLIAAPDISPLFTFPPSSDLFVALAADQTTPMLLTPLRGVQVAALALEPLASLTPERLAALDYTAQPVTIDATQMIAARLDDGIYRILGPMTLNADATVTFTVWTPESSSVPEPGSVGLVGIGLLLTFGLIVWKTRVSKGGEKTMKCWKIFLLIGIFLSMCASAALAVEVQVVVIGHGYVSGKDMSCMATCSQSYEKGAVVQFKAIPFPDSQFAGWTVNGESHQGVITIEKDTVVTAVFERSSADPNLSDGITVYWYNGNGGREYATIALDEIVIQLDDTKYWDSLSDDAYQNAVQSFISRFHEQAIAKRGYPGLLLLQSPQPLDKERWFMSVAELQQIDGIRWVGPMLYRASEYTWGKRIVGNEIYVDFPQAYSEEQIKRIEQEYHLKRVHVSTTIPNSFTYQAKNPLEAIGLANHLYESGLVEYSEPAIPDNVTPTSEPADELFKSQWHLKNASLASMGEDINVISVWDKYKGAGVVIGIVDDGVEFAHPDLQPNKMLPDNKHHDYIEGDDDPIENNTGNLANGVALLPGASKPKVCASACHGTSVAGVSAAEGFRSGVGITGVAPFAKLIGYRRYLCDNIDKPQECIYSIAKDIYEGMFIGGKNNNIDVYNNSWGCGSTREGMDNKLFKEMRIGTTQQNSIYVFGAGNIKYLEKRNAEGEVIRIPIAANTNYCGMTNSRYTIAVGASGPFGKAHHYSSPGATVLVNAPSGIYTTDRLGADGYESGAISVDYGLLGELGTICQIPSDFYLKAISPLLGQRFENVQTFLNAIETTTQSQQIDSAQLRQNIKLISTCNIFKNENYTEFSGTSAAAPVVSGVVALMIDARKQSGKPSLSWRDVQHILIKTAHKNLGEVGEPLEQEWKRNTNAAGYSHLDKYGFGRVDASAAVKMAIEWTLLSPEEVSQDYVHAELAIGDGALFSDGLPYTHTFSVHEALTVEFVEILFSSDHPRWGDLEITLTSPKGTTSMLAETIDSEERTYDKWKFGSRRHFGESSQGDWVLTIRDNKPNGNKGKWMGVSLKFYGTALPPFVQAVQVKTPDKTFYHAGWTAIQDAAQLVWTWFQESLPVVVGTPVTLQVTASAPMKEMRVEAAGQTYQLTAAPNSSNTIWETTLSLPHDLMATDFPLTIRGKDMNDTPLLPFADTAPKAYPLANSAQSDAGDTVHKLTAQLPIYTWKLTTPGKSVCFDADGGIVCELGASEQGDPASSTTGRVKLRPKTAALQAVGSQSLLLEDDSASRAEHAGIHFLPAGEIEFIIEPGAQELELCQAETKRNDCISMPSPESNTKIVSWRIEKTVREHENLCQVTVRLDAAAYLLEIQPSTLCESVQERSGTFDASAECGWSVAFSYDLEPRGTVIKQLALGEIRTVRKYEGCDYYRRYGTNSVFGNFVLFNDPAECLLLNKSWEEGGESVVQGGRPIFEDVGTPYVSVPIETHITCDWHTSSAFLTGVAPDGTVVVKPLMVKLKGQRGGGQQVYGLRTNCVEETAYQRYRPLVECTYKMEATRLQLASGQNNITIPLHPGEPDAAP